MNDINSSEDLVLGVDFGTTNTCAAYMPKDMDCLTVSFGPSILLESTVFVAREGDTWTAFVGSGAEDEAIAKGQRSNILARTKGHLGHPSMGREVFRKRRTELFDGKDEGWLDPEDVASYLLRFVREEAASFINRSRASRSSAPLAFSRAVLGVPAAAGNGFRIALKRAAELAGFQRTRLVPEPVAGCIDYVATADLELSPGELILVVDIGAGTTDVTLVRCCDDGTLAVELTRGDLSLAGDRVDGHLYRVAREINPDANFVKNATNLRRLRAFKEKVNNIRNDGATRMKTTERLMAVGGRDLPVTLTGSAVLAAGNLVVDGIVGLIDECLREHAELYPQPGFIVQILLLGGATRMRAVDGLEERLVEEFPERFRLQRTVERHDPVAAVARGLARIGDDWSKGRLCPADFSYVPRVPKHTGIAVVDEKKVPDQLLREVNFHSIHFRRNTNAKSSRPRCYSLQSNAAEKRVDHVRLKFLMGGMVYVPPEATNPEILAEYQNECECIGEIRHPLDPPRKGKEVDLNIWFQVDDEGVVSVFVQDLGFDDLDAPKRSKPAEPTEAAVRYPLEFDSLKDDEITSKRARNLRVGVVLAG